MDLTSIMFLLCTLTACFCFGGKTAVGIGSTFFALIYLMVLIDDGKKKKWK